MSEQDKTDDLKVYIGTPSIRIYHGQTTNHRSGGHPRALRVDNSAGDRNIPGQVNTRSALITCPPGQLFYIGYGVPNNHAIHTGPRPPTQLTPVPYAPAQPANPPAGAQLPFGNALQRFGERLRREGLVDAQQYGGLSYLFNPAGKFLPLLPSFLVTQFVPDYGIP